MKIVYVIVAALVVSSLAHSATTYQENTFSASLPDGWIQIPQKVIESAEVAFDKKVPRLQRPHWNMAFQLNRGHNWFTYPYGGIEVENTGRVSLSEWKKFGAASLSPTEAKEVQKQFGTMITSFLISPDAQP